MALSVNTNITSLGVQKNLNSASGALSTSMSRLSSGLRINSAKDDAAGMQIANRLGSQIRGLNVAVANAGNGVSIAQTAEGAMQASTHILQRMRELALQSANGSNSAEDRQSLQQEFSALTGELTRISRSTNFGGRALLDGSFDNVGFQVGANSHETISFGISDISANGLKGAYGEARATGGVVASVEGGKAVQGFSIELTITSFPAGQTNEKLTIGTKVYDVPAMHNATGMIADLDVLLRGTGITATNVGQYILKLTSANPFDIEGTHAQLGVAPNQKTPASAINGLGRNVAFTINGTPISASSGDSVMAVANAINAQAATKVRASESQGRLVLTSTDGGNIELKDGTGPNDPGSLDALGLAPGKVEAKLTADTSVAFNGQSVRFSRGDNIAAIVATINKAETGVTASRDGARLDLLSQRAFTLADGPLGRGLADLQLSGVAGTVSATTTEAAIAGLSVLDAPSSQRSIQVLDGALRQLDSQRTELGAVQNRFASTAANLQSIGQNSMAARGRIQDADFAAQTAELTKQQTLQQASTAILSQANQLPASVLKLLG